MLEKGVFSELAHGFYSESNVCYGTEGEELDYYAIRDEETGVDRNGITYDVVYAWEWNGEKVTEAEYYSKINELFQADTPKCFQGGCSYDDFMKVMND